MKLPRRNFLHLAAGAAVFPAMSRVAKAQAYPSRPVQIIVGYPPGGATDAMARLVAQQLPERLGQQFIVDNRPGPGGNIGTEAVVRATTAIRSSSPPGQTPSVQRSTRNSTSISSTILRRSQASSASRS